MYKPQYGDPTLTVRLPIWQHSALKIIARRQGTTVSGLLRKMVDALIQDEDMHPGPARPIPGQVRIDE